MDRDGDAPTLTEQQREREMTEKRLADEAAGDEDVAQHQRRAEKAHYLRQKLEEQERSEQ